MRWLTSAVVVATIGAAPMSMASAAIAPSPACIPRDAPIHTALTLTAATAITARTADLTLRSAAMGHAVHVAIVLPADYQPRGNARYPVLYLLHGHGGHGYRDWIEHGMESVIGASPVIVVIPDGGYDGWYSDWYGTDVDGHITPPAPAWESFHIRELIPYVDAHYPTRADRTGRAVAGNSMGGFGAASYAARHPDTFVAVGSFSGAVHPLLAWPVGPTVQSVAANLPDQQPPDSCIWGDPVTQRTRWADHDPTKLAANLGSVAVYQRTGDGGPGRYNTDPAQPPSPGGQFQEFGIGLENHTFDVALSRAHVPHTAVFEDGVHDWPYWLDDLRDFLPIAMHAFETPPIAPPDASFAYTSGAASFAVWDWSFVTDHADEAALVNVSRVSGKGLRAAGRGALQVTTAPLYRPHHDYRVNGAPVTSDAEGRLHFTVAMHERGTTVRIRVAK